MEKEITLDKIIYSLKEEFNQYSDDNFFSPDHIAFQIINTRSDFILRHYGTKVSSIPDAFFSEVCMKLEEHPDQCLEDINILTTTKSLPPLLDIISKSSIKDINLGSLRLKYLNYINIERLPYFNAGKFSSSQLYYSIDNDNKLILFSTSRRLLNEDIKLKVLTSDVESAFELSCDNKNNEGECTDFFNSKFPIDGMAYNVIIQTLRNQLLTKFRVPQDRTNDSSNEADTPNFPEKNYRKEARKDVDNE